MPQAVYGVWGYLGKIAATKVVGSITIGGIAASAAATIASNKLLAPKLPGQSIAGSGNTLRLGRDAAPVRRIIYGERRLGGDMAFLHSTGGTTNEKLHVIILLAAHECEAIDDTFWINDESATLGSGSADSNAIGSGRFAGKVFVNKHLGADDQAADTDLVAQAGGKWTTDHRLRGICYVYVQMLWDQDIFAGGLPNLTFKVKGKKLYDPRTGTTVWSANPALQARDYLVNTDYGLGFDADDEIDDDLVIAAANVCEEPVETA